jgi:hypothetical protein
MIAVSVIEQVDDADYAYTYNCYVLDASGEATSETKWVRNVLSDTLPVGAVSMAWKAADGSYWMKLSAEEAAVVSEEVDFIVDLFDRDDANNLGSLWYGNDNFRITDGVAIATDSEATVYTAKLSSHNYMIKVWGDTTTMYSDPLNSYFWCPTLLWSCKDDYADFKSVYSQARVYRSDPLDPAWIGYINGGGFYGGVQGWQYTSDWPWDLDATATFMLQAQGTNATLSAFGGAYTLDVDTGPYRQKVGMSPWYRVDYNASNILKFKAWISSIPEPPDDESGHGTYADGEYTYTDKYHAGETYNPNA